MNNNPEFLPRRGVRTTQQPASGPPKVELKPIFPDPDDMIPRRPGSVAARRATDAPPPLAAPVPAEQSRAKIEPVNPATTTVKTTTSNQTESSPPHSAEKKKTPDLDEPLTHEEKVLLRECEADIKENLRGFSVVGHRLLQIREGRLYRPTHKTFERFCFDKYEFTKTHANRQILSYLCGSRLASVTDVKIYQPTKESQIRWIADLQPDEQVQVAAEVLAAVGDKRARARDFRAAREKLFPKTSSKTKSTKPVSDAGAEKVPATNAGMPITFDTNLVPLADLKNRADLIYNIFVNPSRKQEGLRLVGELQRELGRWAKWQEESLKATAPQTPPPVPPRPPGIEAGSQYHHDLRQPSEKTAKRTHPEPVWPEVPPELED